MYIPFEKISDQAKVWVYQANRKLNAEEINIIENKAKEFLENWAAHGKALSGSAKTFHNQFLLIAVDEQLNEASGCSIDASVAFVHHLEQFLDVSFFDRSKVAFVDQEQLAGPEDLNDEAIFIESLTDIKQKVAEGKIRENTLIFNNLISSKKDLDLNWIIPANESWLSRYF